MSEKYIETSVKGKRKLGKRSGLWFWFGDDWEIPLKSKDEVSAWGKLKGMTRQKGKIYWAETIGGKRYVKSLETLDIDVAVERRKEFLRAAERENKKDAAAAVRKLSARPGYCSIDELIARYEVAVRKRSGTSEKTARDAVGCCRLVCSRLGIDTAAKGSTAKLNGDFVLKYRDYKLEGLEPGSRAFDSALTTVYSTMQKVKGLLAGWTYSEYRGLSLPDFTDLMKTRVSAPSHQYAMPERGLVERVVKAGRALEGVADEFHIIFMLAYDLGLRADEMAALKWKWFERDSNADGLYVDLSIIKRPDQIYKGKPYSPKGSEGFVMVPRAIWERLVKFFPGDDEAYVLKGSDDARYKAVTVGFSSWMIGQGVKTYKKAHELRKWRGTFWRKYYGLNFAHNHLRHADMRTSQNSYAANVRYDEPLPMDQDLWHLRLNQLNDKRRWM